METTRHFFFMAIGRKANQNSLGDCFGLPAEGRVQTAGMCASGAQPEGAGCERTGPLGPGPVKMVHQNASPA